MNAEDPPSPGRKDPRVHFFNRLAENWDGQGPFADAMIAHLQEHRDLLGLHPGQDLLEVGCGTGKTTGWLVRQVAPGRVTAVDFAPQMVRQAAQKGIDADFRCTDVCRDDLGRSLYDVILCFHCFPHFRDQAAALRSLSRALKARGRLIVMHMAGSDHINEFHAGVDGPVKGDRLPQGTQWDPLLSQASLSRVRLLDREDLFFLEATKAPGAVTGPG
jgi:demethylmenaquinone methyltransferase/2-methoxy-6-polyprenyl-1,4-benzoquinol methylase